MSCCRVSGHLTIACLYWITLASISALPVSNEQHSGPLNSTTQRQSDAPLIGDEVLDYKKKFGCKDLQQNLLESSVTSVGSLTRRVRLICDGQHVADVLVHVNNSKSVGELVEIKKDDVIEIRDDVTANDDVSYKRVDIRENVYQNLANKTAMNSRIPLLRAACVLDTKVVQHVIQKFEPMNFEIIGQKDITTSLDDQANEYYVYKPFVDGIHIVTYVFSKCDGALLEVRTNKTQVGKVCNSRAFAVGGSRNTGPIFYGRYPFCLLVSFSYDNTICFLSNKYVQAIKMDDYATWLPGKEYPIVKFPCHKGMFEYLNKAVAPLLDGFFYITQAQKMLEEWFNYTSLQNPPIAMRGPLGTKIGHQVSATKCLIIFGQGQLRHRPFATAPDIVGHEMGHLVLLTDSQLENHPKTAAVEGMIEAFCDMMGKTLEFYIFGTFKWTMGSWTTNETDGLRPLDTPGADHLDNSLHENGLAFTGATFSRVFYKLAKFYGIRTVMETLMLVRSKFWHTQDEMSVEALACTIIRGTYHMSLDIYDVEGHFRSEGVITSRKCPLEQIPVDVLHVGTDYCRIVSKRKRPFFLLMKNTSQYLVTLETEPRKVMIHVTRDRQGKSRVAPVGLGILVLTMNKVSSSGLYAHFTTGVYAETTVKILSYYSK
ncbi:uncharacterized protein LOC131937951 isoform X2 [Physella acuta]|uniref:uncharacterized protein LOC131937951 isoform X2 n=1 Tax=Physella acuta TaxID=109671 RepID=UPI0027DBC610|nr:uncharacterized protein LOC131937951 isoform X2 [Physella acuta]